MSGTPVRASPVCYVETEILREYAAQDDNVWSGAFGNHRTELIAAIASNFGLSLPYNTDVPSMIAPSARNDRIRYPVETCPRSTNTTFNNVTASNPSPKYRNPAIRNRKPPATAITAKIDQAIENATCLANCGSVK